MFCPNCTSPKLVFQNPTLTFCSDCGYEIFANPKATCSGAIVCGNQTLLIQRKHNPNMGRWSFVGGFLDANEDSKEAMIREAKEEVGIDINPTQIKFLVETKYNYEYQDKTFSIAINCYLIKINDSQKSKIVVGDDASDYKWVNKNELQNLDLPFGDNLVVQKLIAEMGWIDGSELPKIRDEIDITDAEILRLFAKRFELVKSVADYKKANNIPVLQPKRWKEVLESKKKLAAELGISPDFIEEIWERLHTEARRVEEKIV